MVSQRVAASIVNFTLVKIAWKLLSFSFFVQTAPVNRFSSRFSLQRLHETFRNFRPQRIGIDSANFRLRVDQFAGFMGVSRTTLFSYVARH